MRARPEQVLHRQVADFLRVALGGNAVWFHIPNGGGRSRVEAAIFKSLGVRPGIPDLCIIDAGRAIFIELKAVKGSVSVAQRACHMALLHARASVEVCRSLEDVIAFLHHEGVPLKVAVQHTGTAG